MKKLFTLSLFLAVCSCATVFNSGSQTMIANPSNVDAEGVVVDVTTSSGSYKTKLPATIISAPSTFSDVKIRVSDKCYENVEWEFGYRENDRLGGKDPYSASKACAEIVFSSHFRTYLSELKSLQIATVRAGNVIGGGDWARDRIVPDSVIAWGQGRKPNIRSPNSTRPWQHVLEPLSGYLSLASALLKKSEGLNGEAFNFGPPAEVNATVEHLLTELQKNWKTPGWTVETSGLAKKEAGLLKLNCDKALSRLSWKPVLAFEETARFTAEWYHQFYEKRLSDTTAITTDQINEYCKLARSRGLNWAQE
jgi:CDP-glucose 4,6-dehydratase